MNNLNLREGTGYPYPHPRTMDPPPDVRRTFQAIVDLRTGAASGYEVLPRLASPATSPAEWVAAGGLDLDLRVEASAWSEAFEVRDALSDDAFLSLNATPDFLASRECEALFAARGALHGFVIEVTEQEAFASYDRLSGTLSRYRGLGAAVALDAAGTGYASLSHVLALRPEYTKLDPSLVADCDRDTAKAALIEMMTAFAARCGSRLIVEGVETEGELATLARIGVSLGQGNLLSRPQPACCLPPEGVDSLLSRSTRLRFES